MKMVTVALCALMLAGCGLTPRQKVYAVASVLVVGAVAAHELDNGGRKNSCPQDNCGHIVQIPGP